MKNNFCLFGVTVGCIQDLHAGAGDEPRVGPTLKDS